MSSLNSEHEESNDGKKKRKNRVKYPKCYSTFSSDLEVGKTFSVKKQLKQANDNYRVVGGYHLKLKKSDKGRLHVFFLGEGV